MRVSDLIKPSPVGFNEELTTQIAARFLALSGRSMRYIRLVKFLYFVDREALRRWGYPLTWDTYYSMENGPILSCVLNLMRGHPANCDGSYWNSHIRKQFLRSTLTEDPGTSWLTPKTLALIEELWAKYRNTDIVALTHNPNVVPEYKRPQNGTKRTDLSFSEILTALEDEDAEGRAAELEDLRHLRRVLNC